MADNSSNQSMQDWILSRRSAFATLTKYSASDNCPAIATASVSSTFAIFCVILEPMKNPLLALLSDPSTTPSFVLIPIMVVIYILYYTKDTN
jgi:hypothetical protein